MKSLRNVLFVLICGLGMAAGLTASAQEEEGCFSCHWWWDTCDQVSFGEIGQRECIGQEEEGVHGCASWGDNCTPPT